MQERIYELQLDLRKERRKTQQAQQERDDAKGTTERLDLIFQSLPEIQKNMIEEYPRVVRELKAATDQLTALRNALEQAVIAGKYRITWRLQKILEGIAETSPVYNETTMRWEKQI